MAQAQRKKKQTQQQRKKNTTQKAVALLVVVVALAATIAVGLSSGTSAPSVDDGDSAIITGQFQEVTVDGELLPLLPEGDDPALDTPAPVLNGFDFRGNPITVNAQTDTRDTLLVFLAHWCPHCNEEVPKLIDWREKGLIPDNLRVVGITTGSRNDAPNWPPSDWIEEKKWPFEVLADSEEQTAAMAYGLNAYPFMAVVNAEGVLKSRFSGVVEPTALTEIVTAALK